MPIAWHNPMTNTSYLISSTDCTYAAVGKTLDAVGGRHDCSHTPYKAINDSRQVQGTLPTENPPSKGGGTLQQPLGAVACCSRILLTGALPMTSSLA